MNIQWAPCILIAIACVPFAAAEESTAADSKASEAASTSTEDLSQLEIERDTLRTILGKVDQQLAEQLRDFGKREIEATKSAGRESKIELGSATWKEQESQLDKLRSIIKEMTYELSRYDAELVPIERIHVAEWSAGAEVSDAAQRSVLIGAAGIAGFFLTLLAMGRGFRRRLSGIGLAGVVGGLAAAVVAVMVPVQYEAQALINVGVRPPESRRAIASFGGLDEAASYDIFKKTQTQWIRTEYVLGEVVRTAGIMKLHTMQAHKSDPAGFLERELILDYPGDPNLMRVALKGPYRDELPVIVNAVVEAYMTRIVGREKESKLTERKLLEGHLFRYKELYYQKALEYYELTQQLRPEDSEPVRIRREQAASSLKASRDTRNALTERLRELDAQIPATKER